MANLTYREWTNEEEATLREHYQGESRNKLTIESLCFLLDRSPASIRGRIKKLSLQSPRPRWSPQDLEFLQENYGVIPAKEIAEKLGRSTNALKIISYRKLGINQRSNIYTANSVAELLAVSCPKTIVAWRKKGYLQGKRAPFSYGKHRVWCFTYEAIVKCLQERPWLVDFRKMELSYFRSIVKEEYEKDPWFTAEEAAPKFGLVDPNAIKRYVRRGWLTAERMPGAGGLGILVIRQSTIDAFLENDPRREYKHLALKKTRQHKAYFNNNPVALQKIWVLKCPVCKHKTTIKANPNIAGPELKVLFMDIYTNGTCSHGKVCEILKRRVKA